MFMYVVCNDIGVYEGGEISMFYDLMIVKLCIWVLMCVQVIVGMWQVLDEFQVEGIGYNLFFLLVVMDYLKFVVGDIIIVFIVEEYFEGFFGVILFDDQFVCIVVVVVVMYCVVEIWWVCILGWLDNYECYVGEYWVVSLVGQDYFVCIIVDCQGFIVEMEGCKLCVESGWLFGQSFVWFFVDGEFLVMKVDRLFLGLWLCMGGVDLKCYVCCFCVVELVWLMLEKLLLDILKFLLCLMLGLVVCIDVVLGDEVQEGQVLVMVEVMKMENILCVECKVVVKFVNVVLGESLKVDDVIIEFE